LVATAKEEEQMGFASGSVSFRRFRVVGKSHPKAVDQALLDKLAEHVLRPQELGVPEEAEYGWSGGRHVLDDQFGFDTNVFADAVSFGIRIDTHRFPGSMKKAYEAMEEQAIAKANAKKKGEKSGFISKAQKKEVKENVAKRIEEELRGGKFRRSKVLPLLWDLPTQTLYGTASGKSFEMLAELFQRTFELDLQPVSAGTTALRLLEPKGDHRAYESLKPTLFVPGPEGDGQHPEYPWVLKGAEPKDFVGNEFLLWLWHEADARDGTQVKVDGIRDVVFMIDRSIDLDCAYGQTGRDGLRGDAPGRMPEARDAARSGKVPRKVGLLLNVNGADYSLTLNGESFAVGGGKLPEVEDAETPRVLFEERIGLLRDLCAAIDGLFGTFLKVRATAGWDEQVTTLRHWIQQTTPRVHAAA
jgi:hypothetical protein